MLNLTHPATKGRNASHLAFYRQDKTIGPEHLRVINETTLMLSLRPDVSSTMYYCKLNQLGDAEEEVVCLNNVAVGCELIRNSSRCMCTFFVRFKYVTCFLSLQILLKMSLTFTVFRKIGKT